MATVDPESGPTWIELRRSIITVKVGPDAKEYPIYKELACRHSRYFRAMFDREEGAGAFQETTTGIVNLIDVNVRVFEHFFQWLDTQTLSHVDDHLDLLRLYILSERFEAVCLRNQLIDELYHRRLAEINDVDFPALATSEDLWTGDAFTSLYSPAKSLQHLVGQVHPESKTFRFFLDIFVFAHLPIAKLGSERQVLEELPEEFLGDVLLRVTELVRIQQCAGTLPSSLLDLKLKSHSDLTSVMPKEAVISMILVQLLVVKEARERHLHMHKVIEKHDLCVYHEHQHEFERYRCQEAFRESRDKANDYNVLADWRRVKMVHVRRRKKAVDEYCTKYFGDVEVGDYVA